MATNSIIEKVRYLSHERWKELPPEEVYNFFLLSLFERYLKMIKLPNDNKEYVGVDGVAKEHLEEVKEILSQEMKEYNFDIIELGKEKVLGVFSERK